MISRRLSFLAGVMFGMAIFCFWMALSHNQRPLPEFYRITIITSNPEGIDI